LNEHIIVTEKPDEQCVRAKLDSDAPPCSTTHFLLVYSHPDLMRLEIERVLSRAGRSSVTATIFPRRGFPDLRARPESVFVLRDKDGSIKAFHNVCRHRGARILDGSGTCARPSPVLITAGATGKTEAWSGCRCAIPSGSRSQRIRPEAGARRHRARIRVRVSRGRSGAGREDLGQARGGARTYRFEEMVPLAPITTDVWPSIGRLRWTTIWSPITCRSAIPVYIACSHGLRRSALGAGRGRASAGCASSPPPAGPSGFTSRSSARPLLTCRRNCADAGASTARCRIWDRRVPGSDGFLSAPAGRSRQVHRTRNDLRPAGNEPRPARRALPEQSHQHQVNNEDKWLCNACSAGLPRAVISRGRCRRSKGTCSSFTICCGSGFRSSGCLLRRSSSPSR